VYSVARTARSPSGRAVPSGSVIVASVPGSNISVALRAPSASDTWSLVTACSAGAFSSTCITFGE